MKIARKKPGKEQQNVRQQRKTLKFSGQKTGKENNKARRREDLVKGFRQKNRARTLFWTSVTLIILAACTLFFIPRAGREILEGNHATALIIAIVFWGLEITAYFIQIWIARTFKKTAFQKEIKRPAKRKMGGGTIIAFCVAGLALVGLITPIALGVQNGVVVTWSAAVLISTLQIGILFSSKNYILIQLI